MAGLQVGQAYGVFHRLGFGLLVSVPRSLSTQPRFATQALIKDMYFLFLVWLNTGNDWLGYWGKHMKASCFKSVREYQKVRENVSETVVGLYSTVTLEVSNVTSSVPYSLIA